MKEAKYYYIIAEYNGKQYESRPILYNYDDLHDTWELLSNTGKEDSVSIPTNEGSVIIPPGIANKCIYRIVWTDQEPV